LLLVRFDIEMNFIRPANRQLPEGLPWNPEQRQEKQEAAQSKLPPFKISSFTQRLPSDRDSAPVRRLPRFAQGRRFSLETHDWPLTTQDRPTPGCRFTHPMPYFSFTGGGPSQFQNLTARRTSWGTYATP
jgi:hypothetical protein